MSDDRYDEKYDFVRLKKRGKPPVVGGLYKLRMMRGAEFIVRVVKLDASGGGFPGNVLCYIYHVQSHADEHKLSLNRFFLPPFIIDPRLWTSGFAEFLRVEPLDETNSLRQHCFKLPHNDIFYNEYGEKLLEIVKPCGSATLAMCDSLGYELGSMLDGVELKTFTEITEAEDRLLGPP